jgi:malate synthase
MSKSNKSATVPAGITLLVDSNPNYTSILTSGALTFLGDLHRQFESRRHLLLTERTKRQTQLEDGKMPQFAPVKQTKK